MSFVLKELLSLCNDLELFCNEILYCSLYFFKKKFPIIRRIPSFPPKVPYFHPLSRAYVKNIY